METGFDRVEGVQGAVDREAGDGAGLVQAMDVSYRDYAIVQELNKVDFQLTSKDLVHREANGSVLSGCWAMVGLVLVGVLLYWCRRGWSFYRAGIARIFTCCEFRTPIPATFENICRKWRVNSRRLQKWDFGHH